jgi:glycosyltransferase involved in cell wall biosynthesis
MTPTLSVVLPTHNEATHLPHTIDALVDAVRASSFDTELIVVDDGSTDDTASVVEQVSAGRIPLRLIRQPNRGRFEARRVGVQESSRELVLLLDSRVVLSPGALHFVAERVSLGERVWTGHVEVAADGNPYALFWKLIAELAWDDYFAEPRTTQFDAATFDRFPKGSGCFVAPRTLLLEAIESFRSRYAETRYVNDDTPLLRWVAERTPIHVSPEFSAVYAPRTRFRTFVRHSFRRGIVFLDGHGRAESRFYLAALSFYPASLLLVAATLRRPVVAPLAAAAVSAAAGTFALKRRRTRREVAALAALAPVYAFAHGAGMWRGLSLIVRKGSGTTFSRVGGDRAASESDARSS